MTGGVENFVSESASFWLSLDAKGLEGISEVVGKKPSVRLLGAFVLVNHERMSGWNWVRHCRARGLLRQLEVWTLDQKTIGMQVPTKIVGTPACHF